MEGSRQLATKAWLFRDPLGWFTDVGMLMGTPEQLTFIGRDGRTHFEADRCSLEVKWLKREGNGALWLRTGGRVYRLRFARHEYEDDFDPNTGDEGVGDLVEDLAGITDWRAMLGPGRDSVRAWKAFLVESAPLRAASRVLSGPAVGAAGRTRPGPTRTAAGGCRAGR